MGDNDRMGGNGRTGVTGRMSGTGRTGGADRLRRPAWYRRPWRVSALAVGVVLASGPVVSTGHASAAGAPVSASPTSAPVLSCQMPLGSPLPTPRATASASRAAGPATAVLAEAAAATLDDDPPSVPGDLTAVLAAPNLSALTWSAATDDTGVTGYEVWGSVYSEIPGWATICATTLVTTVAGTITSVDVGLTPPPNPETTLIRYTFFVRARDAAGNISPRSEPARVTVTPQRR